MRRNRGVTDSFDPSPPKRRESTSARCSADDARLMLRAIIWGVARWAWTPGRQSGELCVSGRYAPSVSVYRLYVDRRGDPILTEPARRALTERVNTVLGIREL